MYGQLPTDPAANPGNDVQALQGLQPQDPGLLSGLKAKLPAVSSLLIPLVMGAVMGGKGKVAKGMGDKPPKAWRGEGLPPEHVGKSTAFTQEEALAAKSGDPGAREALAKKMLARSRAESERGNFTGNVGFGEGAGAGIEEFLKQLGEWSPAEGPFSVKRSVAGAVAKERGDMRSPVRLPEDTRKLTSKASKTLERVAQMPEGPRTSSAWPRQEVNPQKLTGEETGLKLTDPQKGGRAMDVVSRVMARKGMSGAELKGLGTEGRETLGQKATGIRRELETAHESPGGMHPMGELTTDTVTPDQLTRSEGPRSSQSMAARSQRTAARQAIEHAREQYGDRMQDFIDYQHGTISRPELAKKWGVGVKHATDQLTSMFNWVENKTKELRGQIKDAPARRGQEFVEGIKADPKTGRLVRTISEAEGQMPTPDMGDIYGPPSPSRSEAVTPRTRQNPFSDVKPIGKPRPQSKVRSGAAMEPSATLGPVDASLREAKMAKNPAEYQNTLNNMLQRARTYTPGSAAHANVNKQIVDWVKAHERAPWNEPDIAIRPRI